MHDSVHRRIACQLITALALTGLGCIALGIGLILLRDGPMLMDVWRRRSGTIPTLWKSDVLQAATEVMTAAWFVLLGGSLGSFLNVVVYRLPRGMTLLGSSQCPSCRSVIRVRDNIPVWGWIARGGRCFHCWLPIDPHYPRIELVMAVAILVLAVGDIALHGANVTGHLERNSIGFSRTLFELDAVPCIRFAVNAILLFVLIASRQMELDGIRPSARMLWFAMIVTLILLAAVPDASPARWNSGIANADKSWGARQAVMYSVAGALLGFGWGLILSRWFLPATLEMESPLLPMAIGTALGWRAGLIALLLAGFLGTIPAIGTPRGKEPKGPIPARAYLLACVLLWFTWAIWPSFVEQMFALPDSAGTVSPL